jgi:acetyl esterase
MLIDPRLFRPEAISDETRAVNENLQMLMNAQPHMTTFEPEALRRARREGRGVWGAVVVSDIAAERTIPGPAGDIRLRVFAEGDTNGVYLHIHGGGWVLGGCDMNDLAHEYMVREAGVTVVSVEYRLAPEDPYPAGLDDCVAAAAWLIDNCKETFGTTNLTIGGESAGANLAVGTLLRTRDELGYTGWRGANLVYGAYALDGTPSVQNWTERGLILDELTMEWFNNHYLSGVEVDLKDPIISPLYADLTDMPPALFTVGTLDPLLDDSLFMATKWETAGTEAELGVYPGGVHGFDALLTTIGYTARQRMHAFIAERTAG